MNIEESQAQTSQKAIDLDSPFSAADLDAIVENHPEVQSLLTDAPQATLKMAGLVANRVVNRTVKRDRWIYRIIVSVLGLIAIAFVIGAVIPDSAKSLSPQLIATGCAAVGGLLGLLIPSPANIPLTSPIAPWVIALCVVLALSFIWIICFHFFGSSPNNALSSNMVAVSALALGLLGGILAPAPNQTLK